MDTPLLNALLEHIRLRPAPFHMPGHKGRMGRLEAMASPGAMDVTELPDTGDLYAGEDAIAQAEELWAKAWHFESCQFLTGGSTQGIHAAMLLAAREGKTVVVDRCCHRSVYNALGLFDLDPVYLYRAQDRPVAARTLERVLGEAEGEGKKVSSVCITSPTYYGVLSFIPELAQIAHRHGAKLIVDAAHGAHLPFIGGEPCKGADLVVTSAHKTMAAYGQGALLFANGAYSPRDLRWAASVCGTSSPSYPIMASLDYARHVLESDRGRANMEWAVRANRALREEFPYLQTDGDIDPLRFTLLVNAVAADGYQVKEYLEARGVFPEMADRDHVVFLLSGANTQEDMDRLWDGLRAVDEAWPGVYSRSMLPLEAPRGEIVLSPAAALTAKRTLRPLKDSEGLVCLQQVAPYPPGVPVIAPGERITKKGLAYLREVGYNVLQDVYVLDEEGSGAR